MLNSENPSDKKKIVVSHRIISTQNKNGEVTYRTKGDANDKPDYNSINTSNIIGRVFISIPFIGHIIILSQLTHHFWLFLLLWLIFVLKIIL